MTGDNIPSNTHFESFLSPEIEVFIILLLCIVVIIVITLSVIIYEKSQTIKRQQNFLNSTLTEREQNLISNYRNLNNHGKDIIDKKCKDFTDNGATRKFEDDGN